ncbi:anaphase-promoting complex subunit 7-like [Actinia tenebrosa]|uniref:Anaphase-promoting complex subunit 7-like n=1 Tax=Actinia tenebrosa TaxID=6105 RepID=A0A6P8HC49_ACTTE|nr:anaphase-promoting complex subunit 7-like [Actinia tenebrosa]
MQMVGIEDIKSLHEAGLFSSAKLLTSFSMSVQEKDNQDKQDVTNLTTKSSLMVLFGDSLFEDEQFRRAEYYYSKALQCRKAISKTKSKTSTSQGLILEVEVKYKVYQCYTCLKEHKEALAILEGVSQKQRTPKINMALASLYHRQGMERSAISCYKEVLRVCPLALEAATGLLKLGITATEVISLVTKNQQSTSGTLANSDWLTSWIKAQALEATSKHTKAAQSFKALEQQVLHDNVEVLCSTAENYYQAGDVKNSKAVFQRCHLLDPHTLQGMDIYSYLLAQDNSSKELEKLAKDLIQVTQLKAEPWIAMAHFCDLTNRKPRAVYFAQKAHTIDVRNVQALILKASLLQALGKHQEALIHYREAVKLSPTNIDATKGLVECYMTADRNRDAMAVAKNAHKALGATARTLTLCATVMMHESSNYDKAKTMLEKAINLDPSSNDAVCLLAEVHGKKQEYSKAIDLLRKHLINHRTARLHQLLGDYLVMTNEYQEALDQYTKSLSLNPGYSKAIEGIQNVEKRNGSVDLDSDDDALDTNNAEVISLEEDDAEDAASWTSQDLQGPLF